MPIVLITGASSGIGAALAREWARQGADVALLARRTDWLEALAAEIRGMGRRAAAAPCDVAVDGDLERAVALVHTDLGPIDIVVANAGFGVLGDVEGLTLDDYRRQFETNVFGVLRTFYATLDDLKQRRGRFVIIGSVLGHLSLPGNSPYAMSKFAVRALALSLDHELRRHGASATHISPGFIATEFHQIDNRGARHADAKDVVGRLRIPADKAARIIIRAVNRRRADRVITALGHTVVFLSRHTPRLWRFIIQRAGIRSRKAAS